MAVVVALLLGGALVAGAGATPAAQTECAFPVTLTDATGSEVTVDERPDEVVVLGPSAAQTLWDVGAREQVVGMPVGQYTAYLEGSSEREDVYTQDDSVNQEKVVAMGPDLVIAPNIITNDTVAGLRDAGVTVYRADFGRSLAAINEKTRLFGRLTGNCQAADGTVAAVRDRVETVEAAVAGEDRPRVLYYSFNFTAGQGTFVTSLIEIAGGSNVAAEAGVTGYEPINPELVADSDPEWVVHQGSSTPPTGPPYSGTTAYERNQTVAVDANLVSQAGPRVVQPLTTMAAAFHPEAYASANASTPTPTATASATPTASPSPSDTTAGDGAGFGALVAVVAVGLALLARRR